MPVPPIGYSNLTLTSSYPNLAKEIKQIISNTKFDGFWIKRNLSFRKVLTKGGVYPDPTLRLYRKERRYPALMSMNRLLLMGRLINFKTTFFIMLTRLLNVSYLEITVIVLFSPKSKIPHLSTISS